MLYCDAEGQVVERQTCAQVPTELERGREVTRVVVEGVGQEVHAAPRLEITKRVFDAPDRRQINVATVRDRVIPSLAASVHRPCEIAGAAGAAVLLVKR